MPDRSPDIRTFLPLNPRFFAILAALLSGPAHGYRLRDAIETRSEGTVLVDPGSLYRMVARLVDDGLIHEVQAPEGEDTSDARRRYYGVTDLGRAVAQAESQRLRSLLGDVERASGGATG